jgi:glycosyltransferase involved in cell wall biosynthesis
MSVVAFVLTKNEATNIERCVRALVACGLDTVVLDSGSTDRTVDLARAAGAVVEVRPYTNHCDAYRYICADRSPAGEPVMVVDADMVVSSALVEEALALVGTGGMEVVAAPVLMHWNGRPLRHGSLCPAKPFLFRAGRAYFEPVGHGERLRGDVRLGVTRNSLIHDDRKPFDVFLDAQARYARQLQSRSNLGTLTWRDRIRKVSPAMVVVTPFVSLFVKGGILCGRAGLGYAMDRLIAEAVMYRQSLASATRDAPADDPGGAEGENPV